MAFDQDLTCLIFPFRWACFPIKIGRNAQWVHSFSIDFDEFSIIYLIFDGKTIFQWVHHILSIEACDAIRPGLNGYISIIISVDTLCGFAPSTSMILLCGYIYIRYECTSIYLDMIQDISLNKVLLFCSITGIVFC